MRIFMSQWKLQLVETKGELITVTKGLSVGEKLVTQGSLSLYAESRKTKTADTATSPEAIATPNS